MPGFEPFSLQHAIVVTACLGVMAAFVWLGVIAGDRERWVRYGWVGLCVIAESVTGWYWLTNWDPGVSLPLHVCNIASLLAPVALLFPARWLRVILYFWGIGLSTQAFLTPLVHEGTAFWLFWINHTQIVGTAVYLLVIEGYRPDWRDYRNITVINVAYAVLITAINLPFGFNYAYIGNQLPETTTLMHKFGPWPWRVFVAWAIVQAVFAAMVAVWMPWTGQDELEDSAFDSVSPSGDPNDDSGELASPR